ncbi:MAG: AAA family ATPase [Porticoccaceae bacterium]|nr:AAA family ATPase [Porticoccaceae bacterium]
MSVEAVLSSGRGLIVAPAGCGKTHLITEVLAVADEKPYLVLTHTTAGVAALKQRLKRLGVPNKNYVVSTIDGWALRIANIFPVSCDVRATPDNPKVFYPELRRKVQGYVAPGHISEIISSSYSRLLVDEYQDCDADQHALICSLSEVLSTTIFGDPMQCIFNFAGPMPSWDGDVKPRFPIITELNTPWRWINAGTPDLGQWILNCRESLLQRRSIDLLSCPGYVHWIQLAGDPQADNQRQTEAQYHIRNSNDPSHSFLVIGDSRNPRSRHNFASLSRGIDVVEPVDLADVTKISSQIDKLCGEELANHVLAATSLMMTGVGKANVIKRMPTILAGRNRTPATPIELAVKEVMESGDKSSVGNLLSCLEVSPDTRLFRRGAFSALKSAVSLSVSDPTKTTKQAAEIVREKRRHQGDRRIPSRAIGSTLLLKGLEADHSLILDAGAMNSHNLYVALSRGAKSITVFSNSNVLL